MSSRTSPPIANRLLAALPRACRARFLDACESVELQFNEILAEPRERTLKVYFPIAGFISLIVPVDNGSNLEVGLIGCEGMLGASLILGIDTSPLRALVQGGGSALCMDAGRFRRELDLSAALQRMLNRYFYVLYSQLAQSAACTRFHVVESRLARWLLMTQDRAHSRQFHITHEFLAFMLGVRRVGVTRAATTLSRGKLISYHRGEITVLDRGGLEGVACGCYAADKAAYEYTMGPRPR